MKQVKQFYLTTVSLYIFFLSLCLSTSWSEHKKMWKRQRIGQPIFLTLHACSTSCWLFQRHAPPLAFTLILRSLPMSLSSLSYGSCKTNLTKGLTGHIKKRDLLDSCLLFFFSVYQLFFWPSDLSSRLAMPACWRSPAHLEARGETMCPSCPRVPSSQPHMCPSPSIYPFSPPCNRREDSVAGDDTQRDCQASSPADGAPSGPSLMRPSGGCVAFVEVGEFVRWWLFICFGRRNNGQVAEFPMGDGELRLVVPMASREVAMSLLTVVSEVPMEQAATDILSPVCEMAKVFQ